MKKNNYCLGNVNTMCDFNTVLYPTTVYLKITNACNCSCSFCSQKCGKTYMRMRDFNRILESLSSVSVSNIVYTGGEPLLHTNLAEMVQKAKAYGFQQVLVTNGLLINENKNVVSEFNTVGISLHGNEKMHDNVMHNKGAYKRVIDAFNILKEKNVNTIINYTMTEKNADIDNLKHVANMSYKYGFTLNVARLNYIEKGKLINAANLNYMLENINMLREKGYNIEVSNCISACLVDEKYRSLTHGCSAGQTIAAIEANGDMKICPSSPIVLGNILEHTIKHIWNCKEMKIYKKGVWIPAKCKTCIDFIRCKSGCKAENDGRFWEHICDYEIEKKWNDVWNTIKNKKLTLRINRVSNYGEDYYFHAKPIIKCTQVYFEIITSIDGEKTGTEIVKLYSKTIQQKEMIELLVALYLDSIIG